MVTCPGPSPRSQTCDPLTYASTGSPKRSSRAMISSGVARQTEVATRLMTAMLAAVRWAAVLAIVFAACSSSAARRALPPPTTSTSVPVPTPPTTAAPTTTTEPGPGQCPTVPPRAQPRADRTIYHLTVNVDAAHNTVTGTVDAKFTPDLATDRLVFRLWPNGPVLSGAGAHLQAGQVVVDGTPAASQLANPTTLVVPHPVAAAQTVDSSLS